MNTNQEEILKRIKTYKLFVAAPLYGGNGAGLFFKSCLNLQAACMQIGIDVKFSFLFNESLITRARNYLVDEFLRSDCSHLLFIDSDIEFQHDDVLSLLAIDKDVIGAPYPKKSINWTNILEGVKRKPNIQPGELEKLAGEYVFNPIPGTTQFNVTQPIQVMEIGTGYMLIKREVFTKFKQEYPHLQYKPDHQGQANFDGSRYIHAYFDTVIDPQSDRYLSEDYMFCQYWRAIGGEIWMCPWMQTTHVGSYGFKGDMPFIANTTGKLS
jgi:hypothetical protein